MSEFNVTMAQLLRRPFTVHAVQFRILEGRDGKRANCAAYITARTAIDRLNHVCPTLWADRYEQVEGGLRCDLTIDGVTRSDVGWSSGTGNAMALKTLYSDAFKRAAVKWGVGVSLYSLPNMVLYVEPGHVRVYSGRGGRDGAGGKPKYFLTDKGQIELRGRYEQWLDAHGNAHFGEPLDHGHVEGSADPEDAPLDEIASDVAPDGGPIYLPTDVLPVIERATQLGHAQFSDPATVQVMVAGRSANVVRAWAKDAMLQLDKIETSKAGDDAS